MDFKQRMEAVNLKNTIKMYAVATGRYPQFITAYAMYEPRKDEKRKLVNPKFHDYFEAQAIYELQTLCGDKLGSNPNDPGHPVRMLLDNFNRTGKAARAAANTEE